MLLPRDQALRFINGYKAVLLRVLSNAKIKTTKSIENDLVKARGLLKGEPALAEEAMAQLLAEGEGPEESVVAAIRTLRVELWLYVQHSKTYAVLLDKDASNAYAVRALTTPLNELLDEPPFAFEAGLVEFEGLYVSDGLAVSPVALGPGYRSQLKAAYSALRKTGRFHARAAA